MNTLPLGTGGWLTSRTLPYCRRGSCRGRGLANDEKRLWRSSALNMASVAHSKASTNFSPPISGAWSNFTPSLQRAGGSLFRQRVPSRCAPIGCRCRLRRVAMASSSLRRWPSAVTPSFLRSSAWQDRFLYLVLRNAASFFGKAQAPQPDHISIGTRPNQRRRTSSFGG